MPRGDARPSHDRLFTAALGSVAGVYALLIVALLAAMAWRVEAGAVRRTLASPEIRYAIALSIVSATLAALLATIVAVPAGYLLSRRRFWGKSVVESIFDVPIVLPPLVVGLALLILFRTPAGQAVEAAVASLGIPGVRGVTFEVPAVVAAQFTVAAAFAIRAMRVAFDGLSPRGEDVARTLGCSRREAFFLVVLGEARGGMLAAFTLAWARSIGEFGPLLVFAGITRMKTETLSGSVFLALNVGDVAGALSVSLVMVAVAAVALVATRAAGRSGAMT